MHTRCLRIHARCSFNSGNPECLKEVHYKKSTENFIFKLPAESKGPKKKEKEEKLNIILADYTDRVTMQDRAIFRRQMDVNTGSPLSCVHGIAVGGDSSCRRRNPGDLFTSLIQKKKGSVTVC